MSKTNLFKLLSDRSGTMSSENLENASNFDDSAMTLVAYKKCNQLIKRACIKLEGDELRCLIHIS